MLHHTFFFIRSEDEEEGIKGTKRKREKLTRDQLNKRKARNLATYEESKRKEEKDLLKSLDSLPRVIKGIEAEEKRLEDMKIIREVFFIMLLLAPSNPSLPPSYDICIFILDQGYLKPVTVNDSSCSAIYQIA